MVALDLPGFGGSDDPPRPAARGVSRALRRWRSWTGSGIARASLVGNSLGGAVAIVVAAQQPERVDRLVLIDSAGYNFAAGDRPWLLRAGGLGPLRPPARAPARAAAPGARSGCARSSTTTGWSRRSSVDEYVAPLMRPGRDAPPLQALLTASGDGLRLPGADRRGCARRPWSSGAATTRWIPVEHADRFVAAIPGSRKVVLEGCGHMPQEERRRR